MFVSNNAHKSKNDSYQLYEMKFKEFLKDFQVLYKKKNQDFNFKLQLLDQDSK